jgi:hypothetical protein
MSGAEKQNGDVPPEQAAELHEYRNAPTHPIAHRTSGKHAHHKKPHADTAEYERMYKESIEHPAKFWDKVRHPLRARDT